MPTNFEIFLEGDSTFLAQNLYKKLNPDEWPFQLEDLPFGSALVGGAIRDAFLNRQTKRKDLDFVVPKEAINLTRDLCKKFGGTLVILDEKRDVARLVLDDWSIDLAAQFGGTLEQDLFRRDFTVNSIALTLSPSPVLIDPTGGIRHIVSRSLVAVSEKNLIDDPLRLLRGLRMVAEFNFSFEKDTKNYLISHSSLLQNIAPERIKGELERLVYGLWADEAIRISDKTKLLEPWQPSLKDSKIELPSLKDISIFNSEELKNALPLVRLTYLLSDAGLAELRFSRKKSQACYSLRYWQKRNNGFGFQDLEEKDRLQLHKDLETSLPALILGLSKKDQKDWIKRWRDPSDPLFHPSCPLDGNTLQAFFDAPEGPWIGDLRRFLCKERAFGRLQNREEAFQLARYWWKQNQPFCD